MSTLSIRHVHPDDAPSIGEILQSAQVVQGTLRLPYAAASVLAARIADQPGAYKLVAHAAGRIAGYAELLTHPELPRHRHAGDLNLITTHPDFRGAGVGDALLGAVLDLSDRWLGLTRLGLIVWAGNAAAIDLYRRHGFEEEGRLRRYVLIGGALCDAIAMARLSPAKVNQRISRSNDRPGRAADSLPDAAIIASWTWS
jgi:putative acetyltransferase